MTPFFNSRRFPSHFTHSASRPSLLFFLACVGGGDPLHVYVSSTDFDDLVHDDTHGSMAMATTTTSMMRALRSAQRDHTLLIRNNLLQKFLQSSTNRVPAAVPLSPGRGRCAKFPNPQGSTALDASRIAENSHRRSVRLCRNCYLSTNAQSTSLSIALEYRAGGH